MTLIITAAADDSIVQVSDRRLTLPDGRVCSENACKAICVQCLDAHFSIAYTGLACIGLSSKSQPTDHWLVDFLTNTGAMEKSFPDLVERLRVHACREFVLLRSLGDRRGVTFVLGGYCQAKVIMALVSNQEDSRGKWLRPVAEDFQAGYFLRNKHPMHKLDVMVNGKESAITSVLRDAIQRIRRRFHDHSPEQRVSVLVELMRRAADQPAAKGCIGKECISVLTKRDGSVIANFHPMGSTATSHYPHFVRRGMAFKDITVRTEDLDQRPRS